MHGYFPEVDGAVAKLQEIAPLLDACNSILSVPVNFVEIRVGDARAS